jgi:hypothetical protein
LYVPGWSTSWMMNSPSQGGDSLCTNVEEEIYILGVTLLGNS